MKDWRQRLVDDEGGLRALLRSSQRIAVLGIKTVDQIDQPAYYVPRYLQEAGFEVIPVPVYFPEIDRILGQKVYRKLVDVPGRIDLVNVFRRASDLQSHLPDLLAAAPGAVWLQQGIREHRFAETLARAGMRVVQDRCLMVEHQRLLA